MQSVLDRSVAYSNYMRVMPLGASITSGYGSASGLLYCVRIGDARLTCVPGNGYRQILKDTIVARGLDLNYVGTQHSGNMTDDDNEAYGGLRIEEVQAKIATGLKYLPSVVLVLLGSNGTPLSLPPSPPKEYPVNSFPDMAQNFDVANAHTRMGVLVDYIFNTVPNTTILVAKLPPNGNAATEANVKIFNANLDKMAAARPRAKLLLANMHAALDPATDLIADGLHPNDAGYKKIATVWENTIAWAFLMVCPPPSRLSDCNCVLALRDGDGSCMRERRTVY
jgi:lysophospholipase L1-like esterase